MMKKVFTVLFLFAFFSCLQGNYSDYVLCLDVYGRMEVEVSHDGHCGAKSHDIFKESHSPVLQFNSKEDCSPCVDIPFFMGDFSQSSIPFKSRILNEIRLFVLDIVQLKLRFSKFTKNNLFPRHFKNSLQNSLQTTVLRI